MTTSGSIREARRWRRELSAVCLIALATAGCTTGQSTRASGGTPPPSTASAPAPSAAPSSAPAPVEEVDIDPVVGTVVRFSSEAGSVDVTLDEDNPATRDLLAMLPVTLTFEDFAAAEKIAYPPRALEVAGSPPASAGAGDLAIYTPWGNLALFYAGERGEPSDTIVHLGTFDATPEELAFLERGPVTVDVAG